MLSRLLLWESRLGEIGDKEALQPLITRLAKTDKNVGTSASEGVRKTLVKVLEKNWPQESAQAIETIRLHFAKSAVRGEAPLCFQCFSILRRKYSSNIEAVIRDMIGAGSSVRVMHSGSERESRESMEWEGNICSKCRLIFCGRCVRSLNNWAEGTLPCPKCRGRIQSVNSSILSEVFCED